MYIVTDIPAEGHSFTILANTFRKRTQQWDKKYIKSFGLVTPDGYLTNAEALFADDCPLPQSRLYCTRWTGVGKDDAINDAEFTGNILMLLQQALNFVKSNTRNGWEKLPGGKKNSHEYAERAVLEGLVNLLFIETILNSALRLPSISTTTASRPLRPKVSPRGSIPRGSISTESHPCAAIP